MKKEIKINKFLKARQEKGLYQWEVAKECNLSINGYINIEKGITKNPKSEVLSRLKEVLGV